MLNQLKWLRNTDAASAFLSMEICTRKYITARNFRVTHSKLPPVDWAHGELARGKVIQSEGLVDKCFLARSATFRTISYLIWSALESLLDNAAGLYFFWFTRRDPPRRAKSGTECKERRTTCTGLYIR